ncbi:MAG: hypothetical protein R3240_08495 [Gammaproteobacteria bacterium]|nr:hypothetical protein [Gammaproteobacteria bacterium]
MKIALLLVLIAFSSYAGAIELSSNTTLANAGYYQLSWTAPDHEPVILEEAHSNKFLQTREIYRGNDTSTAISGKTNGDYYYRIKTVDSPQWSNSINVRVEHHSLGKAFLFFAFGFIVFAATCVVIIRNHKAL